jgi:hypothetical protein
MLNKSLQVSYIFLVVQKHHFNIPVNLLHLLRLLIMIHDIILLQEEMHSYVIEII